MTPHQRETWRASMAGRKVAGYSGFLFKVRPGFWLRRWARFLFFFECHKPSFQVSMTRPADDIKEEWTKTGKVPIHINFANGSMHPFTLDLPVS